MKVRDEALNVYSWKKLSPQKGHMYKTAKKNLMRRGDGVDAGVVNRVLSGESLKYSKALSVR